MTFLLVFVIMTVLVVYYLQSELAKVVVQVCEGNENVNRRGVLEHNPIW